MTATPERVREQDAVAPVVPVLDVVIPVHNEEAGLEPAVRRLRAHLADLPVTAVITIADNASSDGTAAVC